MSSPRPTRGSRYNSPFAPMGNPDPARSIADTGTAMRKKGPMDRWLEPNLAPPRPSFAEAGIERHGVVQNMAPLGTLPSAKVLKAAARPDSMDPNGRGGIVKRPGASSVSVTPSESIATPEPSAIPQQRRPSLADTVAETETVADEEQMVQQEVEPVEEPMLETVVESREPVMDKSPPPPPPAPAATPAATAAPAPAPVPAPSPSSAPAPAPSPSPYAAPVVPARATPSPYATISPYAAPAPAPPPVSVLESALVDPALIDPNMVPPTPSTATTPPIPRTPVLQTVSRPPSQGIPYGQSVFALQRPIPLTTPRPVPQPVIPPPMMNAHGEYDIDLRITDRVVEEAVSRALDEKRWPTAYALRTLYDDHRLNPRMVRLIDAIYNRRADENQRREFASVMTHKKKEGKKERTGEYYFNGDGSDPLPPKGGISALPNAQSPYDTPLGRSATGVRSMSEALQARRPSFNFPSSTSPYKDLDAGLHPSKKHKGNDFQAASDLEMNGDADADADGEADASNEGMKAQEQEAPAEQNGTPKIKTRRSESVTSSSSLSSVGSHNFTPQKNSSHHHSHNKEAVTSPRFARAHTHGHGHANTTSTTETSHPSMRNQSQPISESHKPGPKTFTFSTVNPSPASTSGALPSSTNKSANNTKSSHRRHSSAATNNASMAPAVLLPQSSKNSSAVREKLPPQVVFKTKKGPSKDLGPSQDEDDLKRRLKEKARQKIRENSKRVVESFERHQVPLPEVESASDGGDSIAAVGPSKRPTVRLLNKKTRQSQAVNYDSDTLSSPTLLNFDNQIAPGSLSVSRAGTPNTFNRPTRKGKTGTGLRVKTSPMKKKGGTLAAGIPRASGERNSPTNGAFSSNNQDDNDDYCSSCGGNGDLVCCDGCTRSFHFKCVDPPINEGALPDDWFCNICRDRRDPQEERDGSFGPLLSNLVKKNPTAFHLPQDIRDYFENVKTGAEGEYEEVVPPKAKENKRGGPNWEEQADYFRLKDSKGKAILCYNCHGAASAPDRAIIPCTFCGLYWHLDCLEVPLAKEPAPGKPWKCPIHVDDMLATLPNVLAPAHRFRKIKGASIIKPAVSRGTKNNGHIEIENEPTDDEEELGFYEQREYGHIYKLPEMGIKLDFISQVRKKYGGKYVLPPQPPRHRTKPSPPIRGWDQRTLSDQQAALNLASLVIPAPETGDAKVLIDTLLAEAPRSVVDLLARGDANNNATKLTKNALLALKALVDSKLAAFGDSPAVEASLTPALSPSFSPAPATESFKAPTPPTEVPVVDMVDGEMVDGHTIIEDIRPTKEIGPVKQVEVVGEIESIAEVDGNKDVEMSG